MRARFHGLAFVPNGKQLVALAEGKWEEGARGNRPGRLAWSPPPSDALMLWDAESGVLLRTVPLDAAAGVARLWPRFAPLAVSSDGKTLAVLTPRGPYLGCADLGGKFSHIPLDAALAVTAGGAAIGSQTFAEGKTQEKVVIFDLGEQRVKREIEQP